MNLPQTRDGYGSTQDGVMQDYRPLFKTPDDEGDLHSFFSPSRVPSGLTDQEVALCLMLAPLVEAWRERHFEKRQRYYEKTLPPEIFYGLEEFGYTPKQITGFLAASARPSLPKMLSTSPMTREAFLLGIRELRKILEEPSTPV